MIDPHTISRPDAPTPNTATMSQVARHLQGRSLCLLTSVITYDMYCKRVVSGNRVLCMPCRERLLAAGVPTLTFDMQVVDVNKNEATLVDRLKRLA